MTAAILRKRIRSNFVQLPNDTVRDERLSYKAVGVLAHILSLPDGTPVSATYLANGHTDGRAAILSALRELTECGYYRVDRVRRDGGTFGMEVQVSNVPDINSPECGFPTSDKPASGEPTSENPTPSNKHSLDKDLKKENTLELTLVTDNEPDRFEEFWAAYPLRKGQRVGKIAARAKWDKLTAAEREDVMAAVRSYAAHCDRGTYPKDAERFLAKDYWRDWVGVNIEPERKPGDRRISDDRIGESGEVQVTRA